MSLRNLSGDQLIKEKLLIDKIKHSKSVKMMDEPLHNVDKNKSQRCESMHASIDPSVMVRLNSNSTLDQRE